MTRLLFLSIVLGVSLFACTDPDSNNTSNNTSSDMASDMLLDMTPDQASDQPSDLVSDQGPDLVADQSKDLTEDLSTDATGDITEDLPTDMTTTFPLMGFGTLMGMCDVLDTELQDAQGSVIENQIDFAQDPYDMNDLMRLTMGGQEIIKDGNAGGSSVLSEVFAYEVLYRCELAVLLKTETEIKYSDPNSKITDLLVEIDGQKIGVSVTRAVKFPRDDSTMYSVEQAKGLLNKKLKGILSSSMNVMPEDKWVKQILHVLAYDQQHATALKMAYGQIDASVKADTIVWITVTDGMDEFIY